MKKFVPRMLLVISFIPYLLLIREAAHDYKNGLEMWHSTVYGFDAAWTSILFFGMFLTGIGVLPAAWAIQLTFLVHRKAVKKGLPEKNIKLVTAVHLVGFLIAGTLLALCTANRIF